MKYAKVFLEAIGYELGTNVITSQWIEERLAPLYKKLRLQFGLLEAWTGIRERRWWNPGHRNSEGAAAAARKAFHLSGLQPKDIGTLIYAGVCRDDFEPATACGVASELGLDSNVEIFDLTNACLGVMNGIIDIANRLELGQIKAGLVVACETAREITNIMIERILDEGTMEFFKGAFATLTGGSGAVALILTDGSFSKDKPRLVGGVTQAAPEHHRMCRWGLDTHQPPKVPHIMETNAVGLLNHGKVLVEKIGKVFTREIGWTMEMIDKIICHQVAAPNRNAILQGLGISEEKDFSSFEFLGNMGTVSLPLTAALAVDRGFIEKGDKVGFMGIGSGLNSLMLCWEW